MIKVNNFFVFLLFLFYSSFSFSDVFRIDELELKKAIPLFYQQVLNKPFMIDPVILERQEKVSFYFDDSVNQYDFFKRYLNNMNIHIFTKNGVDYLKYVEPKIKIKYINYVYKPKYRSISYLSENLKDFISSSMVNDENSKINKSSINSSGDTLLVYADVNTIEKVKAILPKLDTKPSQIVVTARILEIKKTDNKQSGISLISSFLNSKLGLNFTMGTVSNNLLSFKVNNITSFFNIFDVENKFNVISSPIVRVLDGEQGSFIVGSDVPTLGAETYRDGQTIRNIDYKSSGVIFKVKPAISDLGIRLNISSELSNFTKTETGVNDTPTLLKRSVDSTVYLKDGHLVVLGGLSENKTDNTKESFFLIPSSIFGTSKKFEKSDIVLLLHASLVKDNENLDLDKKMREMGFD